MTRLARFVLAASLGLGATAAFAQKATYDYDSSADFSRIRTYAWIEEDAPADALNHQRIVRAADAQLTEKGMTRVERSAHPDALLSYRVAYGKNLRVTGSPGWGGYRFGGTGTARVQPLLTGVLFMEIADPSTRAVLWRGIVHRDLDADASPEKRERNIAKTMRKLFASYPPKA